MNDESSQRKFEKPNTRFPQRKIEERNVKDPKRKFMFPNIKFGHSLFGFTLFFQNF